MSLLIAYPALRYSVAAVLIAVAVGLQFVPLFRRSLDPAAEKYPVLKIVQSRMFQLFSCFLRP